MMLTGCGYVIECAISSWVDTGPSGPERISNMGNTNERSKRRKEQTVVRPGTTLFSCENRLQENSLSLCILFPA